MRHKLKPLLSALLTIAMLLSLLPTAVFAASGTGTFTKITTQEELTDGKYVIVVDSGYAMGALDGTWLTATQVTEEGGSLTDPDASLVWEIAVTDSGVTLTDANGTQVAPKGGNNNGIQAGDYTWATSFENGAFRFLGTGEDTVTLASNKNSENKFRAYKNATINAGYPCDFTLYQYVEGTGTPDPGPGPDEPTVISISDALAAADGTEKLTVKGVVTLLDGQNVYLQDGTGGICARMSGQFDDIALGDTVIATGKRDTYNGLPQLGSATYEKSSGVTLTPAVKTIGELTDADICTYVTIEDVTVTEIFDNNGQYANPNITVKDAAGNTIQLYKAVVDKTAVAVDDVITITAAVSVFNGTFQLRNTSADEIVAGQPSEPEPETSSIAEALAAADGTENLTVKGVVTLIDGKNVYLQDSTGGICARMSGQFDDIALGDTVIATGKRDTYNGLPQLGSATYEKSSGLTLTPAVKTIGELTTADICTYVTLRNVEVTEVYDNNGAYSNPNITVKDSSGNTIQLYKAVVGKTDDGAWTVAVGDTITITAAVSAYNTTLQLRNTSADEIQTAGASTGPIYDGEQVVIYNPAYGKALSGTYNGFYNNGTDVALEDGTLSGFTAADVWTVADNGDGTWSFSYDGQNIGMGDSFSSMPLGEKNDKWVLEDAGNGLYYIKNTVRGAYMEWYAEKNNWSSYGKISAGSEGMFALTFYEVTDLPEPPSGDLPEAGAQVVLYNEGAKGVLAGSDGNETSPSVNNAEATVADGVATPANGARVFTVEVNGEWFRFKTSDGYLCSNGTGNNAFYSAEATEDADWKLTAFNGGFNLESRTAKFNGKYSQYLEYYAGSYKTYSLYSDSDKDIYTFNFYPVAEGVTITDGVVNMPAVTFGLLPDAYVGQEYSVSFTVDSVFGVKDISAKYGGTAAELTNDNGTYSFTIPGSAMVAGDLVITISGTDNKDVTFTGTTTLDVKDEPYILEVFPAANTQSGDEKKPEIGFTFGNAGENPTVTLKVNDQDVIPTVENGKASYTPAEAMADGKVSVTATVTRADEKTVSRTWTFTIGTAQYQLYFGQLHSHTAEYSDGAGTLQEGLNYVASLPESANVDFVAFTDHSNYFDTSSDANPEAALYDPEQMSEESAAKWNAYTGAINAFNQEHAGEVVALAGFEMTWSGGPGHINTFNTPGIVSRNNTTLNNKTADAGMKAYYALLSNKNLVNSISQFNHPGTTFGNFSDFGYYDPIIDTRIQLVEVGNGEGAIGAGGYYPSYEQYIMALDKGWHVAPTNNQDNHKGKWGNANDARDVILTDDFSQEGIYQAIRDRRVYATEDKNLEINYTLNGQLLGSIISEVPENVSINVSVYDPDASDSISKVEVVVNSGAVAYTWDDPTELAAGELECAIPADYSYYFIRVTQGDGDLAVTAPVWVGEVVKLGVSSVECGTATPVTGEALTLTTTLFNSESEPATVKSITYSSGGEVLGADTKGYELPASGTMTVDWSYIPDMARVMTVTVTAVLEQGDIEYTYSKDVTLDILDASQLVYIGIDASHYNEYVNGNYKDSMGNFGNLAAGYSVRTVQLNTSEDLIAACENQSGKYKAIILTAPSRRDGDALRDSYVCYSDAEIEALKAFNAAGGTLVLAGWSDYYEHYESFPAADHMAAQQNKVLEALGSSLRIGDDATNDDKLNGGQTQRLYLSTYNWDHFLMNGVEFDPENPNNNLYSQLFSQYGGASIYAVDAEGNPTSTLPDTVSPVVYGHATTYSKDSDSDGLGGDAMPKYAVADGDERLMVLATEDLGDNKGLIIVSGAAFMSNFEVQAEVGDSGAEKNYSNYNICENLVNYLNPVTVTPIEQVQAQELEGVKYTIEGVVTSNASGYDKDTAFFDCIYVQDDTAGINAFPVAGNYKTGDKVRITGTTSSYQGERQIAVTSIEKIGETEAPAPMEITADQLNNGSVLGSLVTLKGTVVSFQEENGSIQTIMVRDSEGNIGRVFIDGYITSDKKIDGLEVGCDITATGLASYDNTFNAPDGPFPRIRVRDRADIVCTVASTSGSTTYAITVEGSDNGTVTASRTRASKGLTITLTVKADEGYELNVLTVTDKNGNEIKLTDKGDGKYTFAMPASAVTVEASFAAKSVENELPFTDVDVDDWFYSAVKYVYDNDLMNGTSATQFSPFMTTSRAMILTILARYNGVDTSTGATWYEAGVAWAVENGVSDGTNLEAAVSREQLVTMLWRLVGSPVIECDLTAYPDSGSVSDWAAQAMAWAVDTGIIIGTGAGTLNPQGNATRAEVVAVLARFAEND